jgi:PAS domain S-box-containing protein
MSPLTYFLIALGGSILILLAVFIDLQREVRRRRQAEIGLRQQTERERLVTEIAQQVRQSLDLDEVLASTVAGVQQFLDADRVLIYRIWEDGTGSAIYETVLFPFPRILGETFPEEVFPQEYHAAYSLGKTRTIANMEQTDVEPCLAEFVKQFGVQAKLVVPILQESREGERKKGQDETPVIPKLWGLLIAHQCRGTRQWARWEVDLMKQLATQVAIAIQQSELYERLQQLNADLEQRVQQRTQELANANGSLKAEIIEHQRTEAALRQTNYTLQALITASPRAIFTLDLEGQVQLWNPAAERMFGWTEAEILNQPNSLFLEEVLQGNLALQQQILQEPIPQMELQYPKKDGNVIDLVISTAPLQDSDGQISGIVAVVADVTEQKRLDEIRLALEQEKELSAVKTRFFSMASHEFRTPLSTALAAAQLLETCQDDWENSEKKLRNLRRIQDSVKNVVQLLDDILTINRAEAGKLEFNPKLLDLEHFCRQFLEEMSLTAGSQYALTFECQGISIPTYLDENLLRSILSNLLSNAIKYSPQGGRINLSLEFQADTVLLQVRDEGIGISPEDQKQLFDPFHRGKNVKTIPGTGLGLVVVKKCVDLHQGRITIQSNVGIGTTCSVTLPLPTNHNLGQKA